METVPFLEDIYPQQALYAITIRSPISKGHLKMVKFPKLPDNYAIITARDIPGENRLADTNMPILADTRLNYKGEPVALLFGSDKIKLEYLASQCSVLTDEEEPLFSHSKAAQPSRLLLEKETGNVDKEFEKDSLIVTSSYSTGIQDHWYAEPTGAVCWYSEERKEKKEEKKKEKKKKKTEIPDNASLSEPDLLVINTATLHPYHVKQSVARVLKMDPVNIVVNQTSLSLHMDGKLWYPSLVACHAALGSFITKKPVRLILYREEDFFFSPKRCASNINIISSINKNGKITALKADISVNLGAYEVNGNEIIDQIAAGTLGFCKIDNLKLSAKGNLSNLPPQGPFCGFGISQGLFAIERHISLTSDMLNIDPAIWRMENLQVPAALMNLAKKMSDYSRKWAAYELLKQAHKNSEPDKEENPRGIGIALGFQGSGMINPYYPLNIPTVEATLTKENKLEVRTSIASSEDYSRIWDKIAADIIPIESIKIITQNAPDCGPSCSSRNITVVTKLFEKCVRQIKAQKSRGGALPITVRRSAKEDNSCFAKPGQACAVVEVSIDLFECTPKIRGVWLGVDGGKIISKNRAKRALIRSAVQALGWAFTENIEYINGELTKHQYDNFSIPGPVEIPPIHIDFLESDKSEPKGIGELAFTCIPAAFLQAVSQAMDYAFKNIPLKRTDIWEMVKMRGTNGN